MEDIIWELKHLMIKWSACFGRFNAMSTHVSRTAFYVVRVLLDIISAGRLTCQDHGGVR